MSKSSEVYDLVIERLVNAGYDFGDRILVKELSAETGASRQPIMSAMSRLRVEGFVEIIPQVGCQVIAPTPRDIGDFFLVFQRVEGVLAELAAARRTEEDLQQLRTIQQRFTQFVTWDKPSSREFALFNQEFHHAMHLAAHTPLLARQQRNNFNMSDFFINQSIGFGALMTNAVGEHDQIVDAIAKQQTERARLEAESHIAAVASAILEGLSRGSKVAAGSGK